MNNSEKLEDNKPRRQRVTRIDSESPVFRWIVPASLIGLTLITVGLGIAAIFVLLD